jgi:hypothetical protein
MFNILGEVGPEVIHSMTGKSETGIASRLCKRGLFTRFLRLVERLPTITGVGKRISCPHMYCDVKAAMHEYQVRENIVVKTCCNVQLWHQNFTFAF